MIEDITNSANRKNKQDYDPIIFEERYLKGDDKSQSNKSTKARIISKSNI